MNYSSSDLFPSNEDKELTIVPQQQSTSTLAWRLDSLLTLKNDTLTTKEFLTAFLHLSLLSTFCPPTPPPAPPVIPPNPHPLISSLILSTTIKPAKLQLDKPKAFNGSYEMAISWMHYIQFYLTVNKKSYSTNVKKITFTLLCMTEGSTLTWGDTFQEKAILNTIIILGTWDNFFRKFQVTFKHQDITRNTISWLST